MSSSGKRVGWRQRILEYPTSNAGAPETATNQPEEPQPSTSGAAQASTENLPVLPAGTEMAPVSEAPTIHPGDSSVKQPGPTLFLINPPGINQTPEFQAMDPTAPSTSALIPPPVILAPSAQPVSMVPIVPTIPMIPTISTGNPANLALLNVNPTNSENLNPEAPS